jgi:hypothetical protein
MALAAHDVTRPGRPKTGGRKKGTPNKATGEIKTFAKQFLESAAYRASLEQRVRAGEAPHMETLLHHYAYGKPKELVEHSGDIGPVTIVHRYEDAT